MRKHTTHGLLAALAPHSCYSQNSAESGSGPASTRTLDTASGSGYGRRVWPSSTLFLLILSRGETQISSKDVFS